MHIGLVATEVSADALGAKLMNDIRSQCPEAKFCGIGGQNMRNAGLKQIIDTKELEAYGLIEIITHIPKLLRYRARLVNEYITRRIDLFIGIDSPDFNIGIEEQLQRAGIKTIHYISPTIWAWRGSRAQRFLAANNRILCLYPFEPPIYNSPKAVFVGHPLATQIAMSNPVAAARKKLKLAKWIAGRQVMALLPGSRTQEIKRLLPAFIQAAVICHAQKKLCFLVSAVNNDKQKVIQRIIAAINPEIDYRIITADNTTVIAASNQVLLANGTATLETLLIKRPMVIAFKLHPLTAWIFFKLAYITRFGQPNWLAGKDIVPEFVQSRVQPQLLAQACVQQLDNTLTCQDEFVAIHKRLQGTEAPSIAHIVCQLYKE